ncbi:hypothetical protein [Streptomyces sp. NPDC059761]|uniref:phage baseplate protein n=1 Tax=Streptomyces sp. NPDC059761 TaxID=3346937 RepID=UPI00365D1037
MERSHLYLPLVDSSGTPYPYAEVTLVDPVTGNPISEPVYLDPHGGAPETWPILVDPAVINLWCNASMRVTVTALLPGGSTYTRTGVDIAPAPSATVRSRDELRIGPAAGLDGSAMLAMSPGGSASWQILDALRFHRHDGAAPGSTVLSPSSTSDIYPKQTWIGRQITGAQGAGAVALGPQGQLNGPDATVVGRGTSTVDGTALGVGASAGSSSVAVAPGATAPGDSQVVIGRNASAAASPAQATLIGTDAVGGAGNSVQVGGLAVTESGSVAIGQGSVDISGLPIAEYIALLGNSVVPRHLKTRDDATIAGGSSTLGFYGSAGSSQPIVSTTSMATDAPGRAAILSLVSALDSLGLIYLTDGALDDELVDWTKTQTHDANLIFETGDSDGSKAGDVDRIRRSATGPGTLTYQLAPQELGDFMLRAFVLGSSANLQNEITVSVSPTGSTWTPVPMTWQPVSPTAASWGQTWGRNKWALPTGMQYLRIKIDLNAQAATPQLGRVIVRPRLNLSTHTPRIDLSGTHTTVFSSVPTDQQTVVQSFAVDPVESVIYWAQLVGDNKMLPGETATVPYTIRENAGDIAITKMSMATQQILGVMYVKGAGHGAGLAVERGSDGLRLWIDADSSSSGFARALARVAFQNGAVLDGKTIPLVRPFGPASGSHGLSCSIDPAYNRIMVRRTWPDPSDGRRHYLYDLDAFKAGNYAPLAIVDQAANSATPDGRSIGTSQGSATWGNYLYTLEGTPQTNNAFITTLDWRTGQVVQRTLLTSNSSLVYREPEGLAFWAPNPAQPQTVRLGYGFAGGPSGGRHATLVTVSAVVP